MRAAASPLWDPRAHLVEGVPGARPGEDVRHPLCRHARGRISALARSLSPA
jgi:hypothetical protein